MNEDARLDLEMKVIRLLRRGDAEPIKFKLGNKESLGGHSCYLGYGDETPGRYMHLLSDADLQRFQVALEADKLPLEVPIQLQHSSLQCQNCSTRDFQLNGYEFVSKSKCPYPDGFEIELDLEVPSGRLFIGNNFAPFFDVKNGQDYNANLSQGTAGITIENAANKAAHLFVGNSCPGVYKIGEEFSVAALPEEEDEVARKYSAEAEEVARIITDLWWVTIVDGDEFEARGCEYDYDEVKVEPGIYRFRYHTLRSDFKRSYEDSQVYATFKRVEDGSGYKEPRLIAV